MKALDVHVLRADAGFDLVDSFAAGLAVFGPRPRPLGTIAFSFIARVVDGVSQHFATPVRLVTQRTDSGYELFFGKVHAADGALRRYPPGRYRLRIDSSLYQRHERDVDVPWRGEPLEIRLAPGYAYPFPLPESLNFRGPSLLRGSVREPDGRGIAGVSLRVDYVVDAPTFGGNDVNRHSVYVTDASGQWVLVFEPHHQRTVKVTYRLPGGLHSAPPPPLQWVDGVELVPGKVASLPETVCRGRVQSTAGAGLSGASVAVAQLPGSVSTSGDGSWAYYFEPAQPNAIVDVTAKLPDGRERTLSGIRVTPRTTSHVQPIEFP